MENLEDSISRARKALRLINDADESEKLEGLRIIEQLSTERDPQLVEFGYNLVILKELLKLTKFEAGDLLRGVNEIIITHYGPNEQHQDDIMEAFLFRFGMSTDFEVCQECVTSISRLVDNMGDNIAKHSKQIMQAADLNNFMSLNDSFVAILEKVKSKLPIRMAI